MDPSLSVSSRLKERPPRLQPFRLAVRPLGGQVLQQVELRAVEGEAHHLPERLLPQRVGPLLERERRRNRRIGAGAGAYAIEGLLSGALSVRARRSHGVAMNTPLQQAGSWRLGGRIGLLRGRATLAMRRFVHVALTRPQVSSLRLVQLRLLGVRGRELGLKFGLGLGLGLGVGWG